MAADLRGDLLGAQADVTAVTRWTAPFPLWTGVLAGPVAWALDLCVSYAIVKWSCTVRSATVLHVMTIVALALVMTGAVTAGMALQATGKDLPTDGGTPRHRARFMAILGLTSCALFALAIFAEAIPRWVLDACL
jgi:hypothetical protein